MGVGLYRGGLFYGEKEGLGVLGFLGAAARVARSEPPWHDARLTGLNVVCNILQNGPRESPTQTATLGLHFVRGGSGQFRRIGSRLDTTNSLRARGAWHGRGPPPGTRLRRPAGDSGYRAWQLGAGCACRRAGSQTKISPPFLRKKDREDCKLNCCRFAYHAESFQSGDRSTGDTYKRRVL